MVFDAGIWGVVEVDAVEREEGCAVAIKSPGNPVARVLYCNYGKEGCTRARCAQPEEEAAKEGPPAGGG